MERYIYDLVSKLVNLIKHKAPKSEIEDKNWTISLEPERKKASGLSQVGRWCIAKMRRVQKKNSCAWEKLCKL